MSTGTQTAEVINLADRRDKTENLRSQTPSVEVQASLFKRTTSSESVLLSADRLYDSPAEKVTSGSIFSRFFNSIVRAHDKLIRAEDDLRNGQTMEADLAYMDAKDIILNMNVFLDLNDSIGLVLLSLIKASSGKQLASEPTDRIYVLKNSVKQLMEYPNLSFDHAMRITDSIEAMHGAIDIAPLWTLQDMVFELAYGEMDPVDAEE